MDELSSFLEKVKLTPTQLESLPREVIINHILTSSELPCSQVPQIAQALKIRLKNEDYMLIGQQRFSNEIFGNPKNPKLRYQKLCQGTYSHLVIQPSLLSDEVRVTPKLISQNIDKIRDWYERELKAIGEIYKMELISVNDNGKDLSVLFLGKIENIDPQDLSSYYQNLADPDDDGNYPLQINGEDFLVTGTLKELNLLSSEEVF